MQATCRHRDRPTAVMRCCTKRSHLPESSCSKRVRLSGVALDGPFGLSACSGQRSIGESRVAGPKPATGFIRDRGRKWALEARLRTTLGASGPALREEAGFGVPSRGVATPSPAEAISPFSVPVIVQMKSVCEQGGAWATVSESRHRTHLAMLGPIGGPSKPVRDAAHRARWIPNGSATGRTFSQGPWRSCWTRFGATGDLLRRSSLQGSRAIPLDHPTEASSSLKSVPEASQCVNLQALRASFLATIPNDPRSSILLSSSLPSTPDVGRTSDGPPLQTERTPNVVSGEAPGRGGHNLNEWPLHRDVLSQTTDLRRLALVTTSQCREWFN